MAIVAIAGGTSPTLGRSIVTAISHQTANTPIILSRMPTASATAPPAKVYDAEVRYVDYTSHSSLVTALSGVETVLSILKIPGPEWSTFQINLLHAAKEAGCKRFAPSEYENGPGSVGKVDILAAKPVVWDACLSSGLEVARFSGGMFMNYLALGARPADVIGPGAPKGKAEEIAQLQAGFTDEPVIWDVRNRKAELPVKADGSFPKLTLTEIGDIGKFVAAACELPLGKWEHTMSFAGDTIQVDKVVNLFEKIIQNEFEVTTVGIEELHKRVDRVQGIGQSRQEVFAKMIGQIELVALEEKMGACILEPVVNNLCPQVRPWTVEKYLEALFK